MLSVIRETCRLELTAYQIHELSVTNRLQQLTILYVSTTGHRRGGALVIGGSGTKDKRQIDNYLHGPRVSVILPFCCPVNYYPYK